MRRFFGFGFGELAGFSAPPAPALDVFKAVSAGQSNGDVRASSLKTVSPSRAARHCGRGESVGV